MTCSFSFSCVKCCLSSQTTQKSERRDGSRIQPQPGVAHDRSEVPNAFKGAPEGYVRIDPNHHLWSKTRVGKAKPDGQFEIVYTSPELIKPDPFPKGYQ